MTKDWSTYFPLESGASFTIESGVLSRGTGTVIARTDATLHLGLHVPGSLLHSALDLVLEIEYRGEGTGNRLALSRDGLAAVEDNNVVIQSDDARSARVISSSSSFDGHHLLLEVQSTDKDSGSLAINAHSFRLHRVVSAPKARATTARLDPASAAVAESPGAVLQIQDWSKIVSFDPAAFYRPRNMAQLESFVTAVATGSIGVNRIRTLGSLHSSSDIDVSDAILDVSDLPKTVEWSADNGRVTASANYTLREFLTELSTRGKSLEATGGTDAQTLAGLISTNTAPATPQVGIYENLQWVEYLSIDPVTKHAVTCRLEKDDPNFMAAICSIGAIGVLTKVQFKVVDELFFTTIQKIVTLDSVLKDVAATSREYDFWRIDWLPEMNVGLLWAANRIPKKDADPNGDYPIDKDEGILNFLFKFDATVLGQSGPLLTPPMAWIYKILGLTYQTLVVTGPLRNMLPVDRRAPLLVAMAEWAFAPSDLDNVRNLCATYYKKNGWPNIPVEIELTKTDNYMMSAWNWPGLDYIVKFNFMYLTETCRTAAERQMIYAHLRGLWVELTNAGIHFKAHWGKINFMDSEFVQKNFDVPRFRPFIRGVFLNDYLSQRLG